jgi:hypothetical protein
MKNVRFWFYAHCDPVKITLRPGQSLTYRECHRTEEGWSGSTDTFIYDEGTKRVFNVWTTEGRDCDGHICRGGILSFSIEDAQAGYTDAEEGRDTHGNPIRYPKWGEFELPEVYDEYAVAAGY